GDGRAGRAGRRRLTAAVVGGEVPPDVGAHRRREAPGSAEGDQSAEGALDAGSGAARRLDGRFDQGGRRGGCRKGEGGRATRRAGGEEGGPARRAGGEEGSAARQAGGQEGSAARRAGREEGREEPR